MPTLTIDSARLNGAPSTGTVRITASRSPLMDSGNNTVYSGTQTFPLDAQGKLSVSLPATDSPSLGAPFTYTVEANLASGQWIYRGVKLPATVATIDITDAQSASQQVYPTRQEWDAITAGMNTAIAGKVTGPGMALRRDTTVGTRVLLDHPGGTTMLYGDTGWRSVTDWLSAGFDTTGGYIRARRNMDTVEIAARLTVPTGSPLIGTSMGNTPILIVPTVIAPRETALVAGHMHVSGKQYGLRLTAFNRELRAIDGAQWTAGMTVEIIARFTTSNAWPTVPFGTP